MSNKVEVFKFENKEVRTVVKHGEPWFVGKDIASILGYTNPQKAIRDHVDSEDRGMNETVTPSGKQNTVVINESGLYSLILSSKLDSAKRFKRWVTSEVLPAIRKTGSYGVDPKIKEKLADARARNARAREASFYLKLADRATVETHKQILLAYSSKALSGDFLLPLPAAARKTYSATEIGERLGISANKVGVLANKHNLKTEENGEWVWDKSPYSPKEVRVFRYYEEAIAVFAKLTEGAA